MNYSPYVEKFGGQLGPQGLPPRWTHNGHVFSGGGYCSELDKTVDEYVAEIEARKKPAPKHERPPVRIKYNEERRAVKPAPLPDLETPGATYWRGVEGEFFRKINTVDMTAYELEQDDCGRLFVDLFMDYFRYNSTRKGFMVWSGDRWVPDTWRISERAAALVAKHIQVKMVETSPDDLRRAAAFVAKIRTTAGVNSILFFAASDPRITTTQEDYDKNPHLLNTPSGVFDLQTGAMCEHRRGDLVTKITRYAPDWKRKPKIFSDFLHRLTLGRADLMEALQVYAGSGCSGRYPKDKIALCQGEGSNCKTVLLEAVADTLGDYAARLDIKYLTQGEKFTPAGHNDELASLAGARFALSVESQEGRNFHEGNVKKMTGGDGLPVSFKHGHTFVMHPAFSLFVLTNHKPRVAGRDLGIWRRMAFFPFDYTVPESEKDLNFKSKLLEADGPCIMAWLIDGCRKWYESGYGNYSTVSEATEQYKRDEDVLGNFIHECCTTDQGFAIQANVLRTAFEKWCAENGERVFSGRAWRQALEERGFHREHGRNGKIWKGLTLNINEEENEVPFL